MVAFIQDRTLRALDMVERIPAGCFGIIVTREDFEPHLQHAEIAIVDTEDTVAQHGELYALKLQISRQAQPAAVLAIVQAYERNGDLWCRFGFRRPGEALPLSDGPFTADGWRQKCVGRIIGAMRPTWQEAGHAR